KLLSYGLKDGKAELQQSLSAFDGGEGVSALAFPLGQQSVIVGGQKGSVRSYMMADRGDAREFVLVHQLEPMPGEILSIVASARDKGFAALDASGNLRLYFLTAERTLLSLRIPLGSRQLLMTPKANG